MSIEDNILGCLENIEDALEGNAFLYGDKVFGTREYWKNIFQIEENRVTK